MEDKKALENSKQDTGIIGGRVIWEDKTGHTVAGLAYSHAQPIRIPVIKSYLSSSNEIAIAYSGSTPPLIIFENENEGIFTSEIEPYKTEIKDDKQIAHYKYRTINDSLESSGIGNPSKVSHMTIASGGPDIKIFEVATIYLNASVTYSAGGQTFNSEESVSTLPGLYVLGWYTTRDYQEGTEFSGSAGSDITVYGKLCWEKDAKAMSIVEKNSSVQKPTAEPTPADSDKPDTADSSDTSKNQDTSDKQDSSGNAETDDSSKSKDQTGESKTDDTSKPAGDNDTKNISDSSASDSGKENKESNFVPVLIILILLIAALCSGIAAFVLIRKKKH